MFEDSAAMLDRNLGAEPDGAGLARLIEYYLSERAFERVEQGCPLPGLTGEAARLPPPARARFETGIENFRRAIATALTAMDAPDADRLASSVLAEMVGAMALARSMSDRAAALALLDSSRQRLLDRLGLGS